MAKKPDKDPLEFLSSSDRKLKKISLMLEPVLASLENLRLTELRLLQATATGLVTKLEKTILIMEDALKRTAEIASVEQLKKS